ncbi:hypothetical protein M9Y10_015427 [Tritrichomonas musculus]|uniref:Uncharacterized protein n=1 Tax=Tritrichomonas musculus TaxID=1915356 RepID=A0ABR2L297_9EUKA
MSECTNSSTNKNRSKIVMRRIRVQQRKERIEDGYSRYYYSEKTVSNVLLGDFDVKNSKGKVFIEDICGKQINEISLHTLFNISKIISELTCIKLERNIYRRKVLIIKWFDTHLKEIEDLKNHISIDLEKTKKY